MDSLFLWMTENGLDPTLVAYVGVAIAFVVLTKMFFFQKHNNADSETARHKADIAPSPTDFEVKDPLEKSQAIVDELPAQIDAVQVNTAIEAEAATIYSKSTESTLQESSKFLDNVQPEPEPAPAPAPAEVMAEKIQKPSFFAKVKSGLAKTKAGMTRQMGDLFLGAKEIDDELLEELETILITSDLGISATTEIIKKLTEQVDRSELKDPAALHQALKDELASILKVVEKPLEIDVQKKPYVILMVGVNGVGKTTTIGKLAKKYQGEGKSVMLAAGDTFRAAAVEQLQVWGDRNDVPVIAQHTGADSASVLFDAIESAKAKGVDVLIADTAGRLQNKDNLMQELQKVIRVMQKHDTTAPHEVMLVLDAGTGQNGLSQAKVFGESVGVTGITLTKLDGTAKGGIIFAIAKSLNLPIRFIGVGEQVDDLQTFVAKDFVKALFD